MIEAYFHRHSQLYLALLTLLIFVLVRLAPVAYVSGDSEHVLLTAQAIAQHGTIRLDAYVPKADGAKVLDVNGHRYSYQPLGTSFFAVPFVWMANLRGEDMADPASNADLQKALAAITVAAAFVLIYLISRCFCGDAASLLLAIVFVLGSSIASSMGTALWSHNLAVVFALLALLLLVLDAKGRSKGGMAYFLGIFLFAAYFVRPTMLVFVVVTFAYLLIWRRSLFLKTVLSFTLPLSLLLIFFWSEYRQLLPYYYQPQRLHYGLALDGLYGILLSPGRGLLIYSPFLILVLVGVAANLRRLVRQPLFWLASLWLALFLVAVSRWGSWWGGWGFGSRLLTDVLPALLLLTLLTWTEMKDAISSPARHLVIGTFVALAAIAVFFNTAQGLYNDYTYAWNGWYRDGPTELRDVAYMLDWRYPQFLASPQLVKERNIEYLLNDEEPLRVDRAVGPYAENVKIEGWYALNPSGRDSCRWSAGTNARLFFRVEPPVVGDGQSLALEITAGTHHTQTVQIQLNGMPLGTIDSKIHWDPSTYTFPVDPVLLRTTDEGRRVNELLLTIPDAASPASLDPTNRDRRILGLCLWQFRFRLVPTSQATGKSTVISRVYSTDDIFHPKGIFELATGIRARSSI